MGTGWRIWRTLGGALIGVAVAWHTGSAQERASGYGIAVTEGAVPGYVDDAVCAQCHGAIASSFKSLGMGRSFAHPETAEVVEDFSALPFYHVPSDRYYAIERRGDGYWFARWRLAADGTRMDVFEQDIDWVMGSGNRSRVYLFRTAEGGMFELPLAWYAQSRRWGMAPGFEFADHPGVTRPVKYQCMSCHNAYPDLPAGAADSSMPAVYPEELPQSIGCQRCHGPGAAHVGLALDREVLGTVLASGVRGAIVNPADLPPERARDICYACHLQPSVSVPSILRPGRTPFDFRPGESLSDHIVQVDIDDALRAPEDRFEINHHPYRMEQSPCFIESGGAFGCTTCHDPHSKPSRADRTTTYRNVCLTCHMVEDGLPVMDAGVHPEIAAEADCTTCHMPARRPQDVPQVWMTDHRIQRGGVPRVPPAPLAKTQAEVAGVHLYRPPADLPDWEATLARALSILSHTGGRADYAADAVGRILGAESPDHIDPWIAFAEAALTLGANELAFRAARQARDLAPDHPVPVKLMGLARVRLGDEDSGRLLTELSLQMSDAMAEQHLNLALIHTTIGDVEAALTEAHRAIARNHVLWPAWRLIGELEAGRGNGAVAARAYEQALAIVPNADEIRTDLIALLGALGQSAAAARHQSLILDGTLPE